LAVHHDFPNQEKTMATLKVPVTATDHIQGDPKAPVVLVEYGDYQCPHCGHAHPIVQRIQKHFGAKLAFVFRNFPLSEMHPEAEPAAEAAEFAGTHEKFWPMHDALFENQDELGEALYLQWAEALKLPPDQLDAALAGHKFKSHIREDFQGGVRSGVNGTPTFFINGHRHDGPFDYEVLVEAIVGQIT
jgi:protein-disulfide isomerase